MVLTVVVITLPPLIKGARVMKGDGWFVELGSRVPSFLIPYLDYHVEFL
jgi:hypothetical protein